ncbi:hypothetical protein HDK64DRAFT_321370, partial [Phyllosticta capitalensis]
LVVCPRTLGWALLWRGGGGRGGRGVLLNLVLGAGDWLGFLVRLYLRTLVDCKRCTVATFVVFHPGCAHLGFESRSFFLVSPGIFELHLVHEAYLGRAPFVSRPDHSTVVDFAPLLHLLELLQSVVTVLHPLSQADSAQGWPSACAIVNFCRKLLGNSNLVVALSLDENKVAGLWVDEVLPALNVLDSADAGHG